jgi:hypothetical protein
MVRAIKPTGAFLGPERVTRPGPFLLRNLLLTGLILLAIFAKIIRI